MVASQCALPPTIRYVPGAWESEWRGTFARRVQRDDPRNWTRGCALMAGETAAIRAWLDFAKERRPASRRGKKPPELTEEATEVLSFHKIVDACTGRTLSFQPLEPLVGFLRHPEAHCPQFPGSKFWTVKGLSKDYLIPAWHTEAWPNGRTRALFFDLGASLYHTGYGGASMSWFVTQYRLRDIQFDRIFAWEAKQYTDATIYSTMPASIVDRVSYYNLAANATPGEKHNPWRTLRAVATPNDFVVVKIDIDNSPVEEALIDQLLADRTLTSLVDELYFEHHVLNTPMWLHGWQKGGTVTTHTLVHSYAIFSQLRELGIRAHSWV
jgi:hypothetical protein